MDFREFYMGLDPVGRLAFADKAKTTPGYIKKMLSVEPSKRPQVRDGLLKRMVEASDDKLTSESLVAYFYSARFEAGSQDGNAASNVA